MDSSIDFKQHEGGTVTGPILEALKESEKLRAEQLLALKAVAVWLAHPSGAFPAETAHQVLDAIEASKEADIKNDTSP